MRIPQIITQLDPDLASDWPNPLSLDQVEQLLIKGIHSGRLTETSNSILELGEEKTTPEARGAVDHALQTCRSISDSMRTERRKMLDLFTGEGIQALAYSDEVDNGLLQTHSFSILLPFQNLVDALRLAQSHGYKSYVPWKKGAWECYTRIHNSVTMVKTDDSTTRMELRWNKESKRGIVSKLWPSELDFDLLDLPSSLWMLYFVVKPFRYIRGQLFGKTVFRKPWPFLGTPIQLTQGLFEMANLTNEDILVDLGCGDGRIVIEAAKQYGCRAIGIELDDSLARFAQQKIVTESLEELVTIKHGDAYSASLPKEPCVVFLFLPIESIPGIIESLHKKLAPGSRIITHEQNEICMSIPPVSSRALLTESAITVAHLWTL